jgi:hypothetical protein
VLFTSTTCLSSQAVSKAKHDSPAATLSVFML